ncbi:MAG TPA: hypothetical protein VF523_07705 [Burkholderiales bacterium]
MPRFPAAQAKIANPDLTPTREYVGLLRAIEDCLQKVQDALDTQATVLTVANLPSAAGLTGTRYMVSDANATTFMSTVAGGGANVVPVVSNGTVWKIG